MRHLSLLACLLVCCALLVCAQSNRGYYRYPALHGDTIVFTSEGDLWTVSTEGGLARKLTSHPGEELTPAFSPDGKTIAYSAVYEGPREIYTMPAAGGLPVRRTFDGAEPYDGAYVAGWTPSGKILYSTGHYAALPADVQLFTISLENNQVSPVPLRQAVQGNFDSDERTLYFTRLIGASSSTKRYQGGTAENLWKWSGSGEASALTGSFAGTSKNPMPWKEHVFFLSDRDGTMNIWSMDRDGKDLRQLTRHQGFDIESASLFEGRIVYAQAGDLRLFDTRSNEDRAVSVQVPSDFDNLREHWVHNPMDYLTSVHLSNDGKNVVLTTRGRAFVAPSGKGRLMDVSRQTRGRLREARSMPDGKSLLAISTESGETELWRYSIAGDDAPEQLTKDAKILRWEAIPSPDGKLIAHQNKNQELFLYDVDKKTNRRIATTVNGNIADSSFGEVHWSPDSRWITWSQSASNQFSQIFLFSVASGKAIPLTTDRYNSGGAAWSPDGKWIYFLSDRSLTTSVLSPWGSRQPDPYFDKQIKLYAVSLEAGKRSLFEPPDELHAEPVESPKDTPAAAKDSAKEKDGSAAKPPVVNIDTNGIAERLQEVPVPPGNYSNLAVLEKRLCWLDHDPETLDNSKDTLQCADINDKGEKPKVLLDGVKLFETSGDGKKMLLRKGNDFFVLDSAVTDAAMKDPKTLADAQVDLKTWQFSVIPTAEFREEFLDAWRLHRDYFYDPNMHNVNWGAMRTKYEELMNRVRDREELSEVLAQMVGELSALHTFVRGGDLRKGVDQITIGALGARLVRDENAGGFRVQHIYRTDPDRPDKLSPLLRQGVSLQDGDLITAINGRRILDCPTVGEALQDQVGKQVLLTYSRAGHPAPMKAVAKAISAHDDDELRYAEWEFTRRLAVEKASGGKMGYIHLRAMGPSDAADWNEQFTPVFDRQGLIIDMRHNFGGNIDSWILDRLSRKVWMYWQARMGDPTWNMQEAFRGHLVVLCDELTSSDGEAFSEGFKRLGLGKVIGTRTWGGEIWLSFSNFLADKGIASAAEIGVYGPEGKWLIEGHGVEPDITVDNLPHASYEGKDAQLEAAIQHLDNLIKKEPRPVPAHPPYPDKSFQPGTKLVTTR